MLRQAGRRPPRIRATISTHIHGASPPSRAKQPPTAGSKAARLPGPAQQLLCCRASSLFQAAMIELVLLSHLKTKSLAHLTIAKSVLLPTRKGSASQIPEPLPQHLGELPASHSAILTHMSYRLGAARSPVRIQPWFFQTQE